MYLYDTDGSRYLDGVSSLWLTVHGHGVPEIDDAIRDQLDRLDHATFLGMTHEPGIELAELLLATAPAGADPGLLRGRRVVGGRGGDQDGVPGTGPARPAAPAVRACRRGLPRRHAGRGQRRRHRPVPLDVPADPARDPHGLLPRRPRARPDAEPSGRARSLAELRARSSSATATRCAPSSSSRSCRRPAACSPTTRRSSRGVRALCDEFGALMVVDEVATGIGRTGRDVGGRARRCRARPDDLRQGADRRLPAAVGGARARGGLRGFPRRAGRGAHVLPRPLLHREPALLRRGHREPAADGRARDGLARGARRRAHRRADQGPQRCTTGCARSVASAR